MMQLTLKLNNYLRLCTIENFGLYQVKVVNRRSTILIIERARVYGIARTTSLTCKIRMRDPIHVISINTKCLNSNSSIVVPSNDQLINVTTTIVNINMFVSRRARLPNSTNGINTTTSSSTRINANFSNSTSNKRARARRSRKQLTIIQDRHLFSLAERRRQGRNRCGRCLFREHVWSLVVNVSLSFSLVI